MGYPQPKSETPSLEARSRSVAALLRSRGEALVSDWLARVRDDPWVPEANRLSRPELRDEVPEFVGHLIEALEAGVVDPREARAAGSGSSSKRHARQRQAKKYSLGSAMREWALLRAALWSACATAGLAADDEVTTFVNAIIDDAMETVARELHEGEQEEILVHTRIAEQRTAELEAVIASMPEAVLIGDATRVRTANRRARDLLGAGSEDAPTESLAALAERLDLRNPESGAPVALKELGWTRAAAGEEVERDVVARSLAGGNRVLHTHVSPIVSGDGEVVGVVGLALDVTDRHRYEQRLADEAKLRDRFVAILGHDLRNPLQAILTSATTLLRRSDATSVEARALRRIVEISVRMSRMISQVLDFARARFAGLSLLPTPIDLVQVCDAAVEEMRAIDAGRPVRLEARGDTTGIWDADRLAQVVSNLVGNAHEHGRRSSPIVIALSGDADKVRLAVTNEGSRIAPDQLEAIFEPFRSGPRVERGAGLGLGLYIVKYIVEAHGGRVWAESDEAGTTTFTVELPRARVTAP